MWLKYSDAPIALDPDKTWEQSTRLGTYTKPTGCWFTDETEYCWRWWCMGENFGLGRLTHKHEVILDEERVMILRSSLELDAFQERFHVIERWGGSSGRHYADRCIDWQRVAQEYAGLIITPYMHDDSSWYYGWDCASGVVWDAKAILAINLIEVSPVIRPADEADAA
jgi:hypothetical protein